MPNSNPAAAAGISRLSHILDEIGLWLFLGVAGFLAITVWQMSLSVSQLATEVKFLGQRETEFISLMETLRGEVTANKRQLDQRADKVNAVSTLVGRADDHEKRISILEHRSRTYTPTSK